MPFEELEKRLQIAKDAYARACASIDASLKSIVSTNPKHLKAAKTLQASYADLEPPLDLAGAEQPVTEQPAPAAPEPPKKDTKKETKKKPA